MIIVKIYYHGNLTPPFVKPSGMAWHNRLTVTRSEGVLDFVITRPSLNHHLSGSLRVLRTRQALLYLMKRQIVQN